MNHTTLLRHQDRSDPATRNASQPAWRARLNVAVLPLVAAHAVIVAALWLRPPWAAALIGTIMVALAAHATVLRQRRRSLPPATPAPDARRVD